MSTMELGKENWRVPSKEDQALARLDAAIEAVRIRNEENAQKAPPLPVE